MEKEIETKVTKKKFKGKLLLGEKIGIGLLILFLICAVTWSIWKPNNSSSDFSSSGTTSPKKTEIITNEEKAKQDAEAKAKSDAEAKKWQPIDLSGYGQQATDKFTLQSGLSIFKMKHSGTHNFSIWLMDTSGKKIELLVNEIGAFDGSKAVSIPYAGDYLLDVSASSNWSVNITQPR